ncbi:DNA phosphorothioation-dependent restriction protein DptG [Neisseria gonorrhoeae]|uniref:DNA phosphorothioation-dependent restriction protein DptG n=1 Tax=Neisseria gonorrhoeae TaxID=485 RepID=UPI00240A91DD|nr:DNA phosphorothioation-dependent restriction protein DptG [Neisseria gonorrhoeae]
MTLKASKQASGRVNLLTLSVLSLFCTPYAWGSDAYDPVKEAEIKNKFILEAAEDRNSHVWRGPCSVSFDCFGAFSYQPGSDTRPTNVGDTADFSFSDKPANGVFHYFSSGKTDQKSSEALYDEINITDNYRTDLKQAVKKQLQDLYKTRPEAWEENKKRVREEIIKQFGISEDVFNKLQQKMPQKINSLIEEQVLTPYILRP